MARVDPQKRRALRAYGVRAEPTLEVPIPHRARDGRGLEIRLRAQRRIQERA